MYGFGLEESGDYAKAEKFGRRAVEINPEDAWSVHSVAHCMEMTERPAEGIEFTRALEPSWSKVNNFRYHLHWHRGLYHIERGEFAEVLDLYDNHFGRDVDTPYYLDMVNATSMLWRLEMFGADVGNRWQVLADIARKRIPPMRLRSQSCFSGCGLWAAAMSNPVRRPVPSATGPPPSASERAPSTHPSAIGPSARPNRAAFP